MADEDQFGPSQGPSPGPEPSTNVVVDAPETFLKPSGAAPAPVSQGKWAAILQSQHLQQGDASTLTVTDADASSKALLFTWSPSEKLRYQFSSERNSTYFLDQASKTIGALKNTAWVGDAQDSGVMLLRPPGPAQDGLLLTETILPAFGLDLNNQGLLKSLLSAAGAISGVKTTLEQPPDWAKGADGKALTPLQLNPNVNVRSRMPTNALWCSTVSSTYFTTIKVTYKLQLDIKLIADWLSQNFGSLQLKDVSSSSIQPVYLTLTKSASFNSASLARNTAPIGSEWTSASIAFSLTQFVLHLDISPDGLGALLVPKASGNIFGMIKNAFGGAGSASASDLSMLPTGQGANDSSPFQALSGLINLWYIGVDVTSGPKASALSKLNWDFGILAVMPLGPIGKKQNLVLALSYDSASHTFAGRTIFAAELASNRSIRSMLWDPRVDPAAALGDVAKDVPASLDILALIGIDSTESLVAPRLDMAQIWFQTANEDGDTQLSIHGHFLMDPIADPLIPFEWKDASVDLGMTKSGGGTGAAAYYLNIASTFVSQGELTDDQKAHLKINPDLPIPSAVFNLGLRLVRSSQGQNTWSLRAEARDLSVKWIKSLFHKDPNDDALGVVERLNVTRVGIDYEFAGTKAASLTMLGVLRLGELELDLKYQKIAAKGWTFSASLRPGSPDSTIASVAESIVPGASDSLPTFVGEIRLNGAPSNSGAPICSLNVNYDDNQAKGGKANILSVWIQFAGFSLTFVQYRTRAKQGGPAGITKRLLRISVDQIPMLDRIPIIDQMPQPFDHLAYLWVDDGTPKPSGPAVSGAGQRGLTRADVDDIQALWPTTDHIPPLQTRDVKESSSSSSNGSDAAPIATKSALATDIALAEGHHFVVVVSGKVVLDHVFNTSKAETQKMQQTPSGAAVANSPGATVAPPSAEVAQPTKGSTKTSAGPLSISALTFQYKQGHLIVSVDATLKMGPLTFSVIGFTIDVDLLEVKLDNLADIVRHGLVSVDLHGIEVGLVQGPFTLAGVFIHDKTATSESYRGGIAVGFKAWQVLAVGEYFVHLDNGVPDYRAVFVYGKLDGPLIELEFATISGVRVGFGYNYAIRMPDVTELTSFPLISDSGLKGSGSDPLAVLDAIRGGDKPFVYPKKDGGWFAAGMTITAFDVLSLTAVLVLDIETSGGDTGVKIAMLADGIFQMEPLAPPDLSLFYIELVVKVELNFVDGYIAADAALAPPSHIYVPMARLTGSASFYTWFGKNPHAGEWVVSIGGYARSYTPESYYPRPSRVGLNFSVGDNIQIIGQAYCAVTPKCAMAGGSLHLSLSVGPVSAYADLIFDAFINFKPFHFVASLSIAVGVDCNINILFVHIHVSISIGADLTLWGPHDFGGRAHVNFWFFGFDISFGADENEDAKKAIPLSDFIKMVTQPGPGKSVPSTDTVGAIGGESTLHKYSVEDGLAPQAATPSAAKGTPFPSTGATSEWHVLAGTLKIRLDCSFALSEAKLVQPKNSKGEDVAPQMIFQADGKTGAPDVYSWPMHCVKTPNKDEKISSSLSITVRKINSSTDKPISGDFRAELVMKTVATALWSVYDAARDPLQKAGGPAPTSLLDAKGGTASLVQAVRILPPLPKRAQSKIIDVDAAAAMRYLIPVSPSIALQVGQGATFGPKLFEGLDSSGKLVDGVKRWGEFKEMWVPKDSGAPAVKEQADEREALASLVSDTLEWFVRPPSEMVKNVPPERQETDAGRPLVPVAPVANVPVSNEWMLSGLPPRRMVSLLDVYFPDLPYVSAAA